MRSLRRITRATVMAAALTGSVVVAAAGASTASARPGRVAVANAQPKLASAKVIGAPSRSQQIEVKLYLADQRSGELADLIKAVSTPGSPSYGKYLTSAQFRARFAPSAANVAAVRAFAKSSGLSVTTVANNHAFIAVRGTVAQVQKAFDTTLKNYSIDGKKVRAAAKATTIPAALDGIVTAVSGVASISSLVSPKHVDRPLVQASSAKATAAAATTAPGSTAGAPPPDAFVNARPCSKYFGQKIATTVPTAYGTAQPYARAGTPRPSSRVPTAYPTQYSGAWMGRASPWRSPTRTPRRRSCPTPTPTRSSTVSRASGRTSSPRCCRLHTVTATTTR